MANLICFQLSRSGFAANMAPFWKREVLGLYGEHFTTLPPLLVPLYHVTIKKLKKFLEEGYLFDKMHRNST